MNILSYKTFESMKRSKYSFVLKNVDIDIINKKYGICDKVKSDSCNILQDDEKDIKKSNVRDVTKDDKSLIESNMITRLADVIDVKDSTISFLDETKYQHTCNVVMINMNTNKELDNKKYTCYWDHHEFTNSKPIGCPIRYISNQAVKTYFSEISKDNYTIKEYISDSKSEMTDSSVITIKKNKYYETDGVVCSFNCMFAFIDDNVHNPLYNNSKMLANKMYSEIFGVTIFNIRPAPHWRLLDKYGGPLTIDKFREGFNGVEHDYYGYLYDVSNFHPIAHIYEQKLKF